MERGLKTHPSLHFQAFKRKEGIMRRMSRQNLINELDNPTTPFLGYPFATRGRNSDRDTLTRSAFSNRESTVRVDTHGPGVRCNTLVLGMGSEFLGDDGLGVHAVRALGTESLPEGTELLEVANHLVEALVALQKADRVILLDVLRAQGNPGSVYRVSFQSVQISDGIPLPHSPDLFRALYLGGCFGFLDVIVIGMEPSVIDYSATLSMEVRNALPLMIRAVKAELDRPAMRCRIADTSSFTVNAEAKHFSDGLRRSA
jgi:hydrogenase maturation protease